MNLLVHMEKDEIIEKLFSKNYKLVLDVGGRKNSYDFLSKNLPNTKIYCININVKDLPRERGKIIICDAQFLPFKKNKFDLVFIREVFEHIIFPDKFLIELKKVLKNGGEIILTTPNLNAWQNRILLFFGFALTNYTPYPMKTYGIPKFFKTRPIYDHPRVFPYKALKEIFNSNGFKLQHICGVNNIEKGRWLKNLRKLIDLIFPNSWKEDIIIKVTKC